MKKLKKGFICIPVKGCPDINGISINEMMTCPEDGDSIKYHWALK